MDSYFDSKEFRDLLARYEEAQQRGESLYLDSDQLSDIGDYYHWRGDTNRALAVADEALSMFEGATSPLLLKARIALLRENNPKKAMQLAEQIEDKYDLDYYNIKAEILIASLKSEEADLWMETCLDQLSEHDYDDFVLDTALLFIDYEQPAFARKWLAKSSETELPDYKEVVGRIHYCEGDYKACEDVFEQLLDEHPYSAYYWDMTACAQLAQGHLSDAITSSEYAIAINPNDEDALLYKAQALMKLKNYEEAIVYFERHGALRPANIDGPLNAGLCKTYLNRYDEGVADLLKAEKAAKEHIPGRLVDIYLELAFAYSQQGKIAEAMEAIDKMERLPESNVDEITVLRGHVYLENQHPDEAQDFFRQAVEHSIYSPIILLRVAISLYDNNYIQVAYNILTGLTPSDFQKIPQAYAYLSICAYDLGLHQEYLNYLKTAAEKAPSETASILGFLFPEGMEPSDYYSYAKNHPTI